MSIHKIFNLYYRFFGNAHYYLYSMSIYHILIILYTLIGISGFNTSIFYGLTLNPYQTNVLNVLDVMNIIESYIYILIILIIDVIFLVIIMLEFRPKILTIKNILFFEIIILSFSMLSPIFRDVMFFLSLNTLQITIIYKIMKYIPLMKDVFIAGSYILIFKLLFFPIQELISIYIITSSI